MTKKQKKHFNQQCDKCDNCVYIGEGDFACMKGVPFIVMEQFTPTEHYGACNNKEQFKQAQQETLDNNGGEC